jgi:hypothetical protein
MADTFDGTDGEWQQLEAPLQDVDPELNIFALANGLDLLKNRSDAPDRTLEWYRDGMERRIGIRAEASGRFRVTVEASRKENGDTLVAAADLSGPLTAEELRAGLRTLLSDGIEAANGLTRDDLGRA